MKIGFTLLAILILSSAHAGTSVVLDVRTKEEFQESHVQEAINIDVQKDSFAKEISKLDKKQAYKLYCRSGRRSGKALEIMKAAGFSHVENLGGLSEAAAKLKAKCEGKKEKC